MWPYGQTPPLEKCEQPDLKHPQAMLQNDICPQNSPREGGRVSPPGPRTKKGHSVLILILHRSCSVWIKSTNRFTTVLTDGPDNRSVLGKDRQLWSLSNLPSDLFEWLDILLVWLACDDSGFYHR